MPTCMTARRALLSAEGLERLNKGGEAEAVIGPMSLDDPERQAVRAALAIDRGEVEEAMRLVTDGPKSTPGSPSYADSALTHQKPAAAVAHFGPHSADPDDRRILFSLGTALKLVGQDAEARCRSDAARRFDALAALAAHTRAEGRVRR